MAFVIKKRGTGLMTQAGSSFGGMTTAKKDIDEYLATDGGWTVKLREARKFKTHAEAEEASHKLPIVPGIGQPYDVAED